MLCRATDRLHQLCLALHLTVADFAARLDLTLRRAKRILKPDRTPSLKLMARVHRAFPRLSAMWLLSGEGEMFSPELPAAGNAVGVNYGTLHQTIIYSGPCAPGFS